MKNLLIVLGLLFSLQSFATDMSLLCNDQNSHSVYRMILSFDLTTAKLITIIADSSVLSSGTKYLKRQEGESSVEMATYAGKTNSGTSLALLFNSQQAAILKPFEILEVNAYYQQRKGDILSGNTLLLCSKE